jgi:hypothetical protein
MDIWFEELIDLWVYGFLPASMAFVLYMIEVVIKLKH